MKDRIAIHLTILEYSRNDVYKDLNLINLYFSHKG